MFEPEIVKYSLMIAEMVTADPTNGMEVFDGYTISDIAKIQDWRNNEYAQDVIMAGAQCIALHFHCNQSTVDPDMETLYHTSERDLKQVTTQVRQLLSCDPKCV